MSKNNGEYHTVSSLWGIVHILWPLGDPEMGEGPGLGVRGLGSVSANGPVSSVTMRKSLAHSGLEFSYLQIVGFE